jgi:hypothetical protein
VSARETPAHLEKVVAAVIQQGVKVDNIVYDDRTFLFYLYSNTK